MAAYVCKANEPFVRIYTAWMCENTDMPYESDVG